MLVPSQSQKTKLGTMMFKFGLNPPYRSIGLSPSRESNIGAGQIFGPILEYIEHNFPEIIELFRFQVFQEVKRGQAFALRYVGKKNIPVKRYEILKERKWIDGMTLLS